MVIHGGGIYGDKEATKERWKQQFKLLPKNVQQRLVLENCEKCFSITDCLDISRDISIPVVFDTHHFECYKQLHPNEQFEEASYYIPAILETWKIRDIKPKFHVSEQGPGRIGHHSDYVEVIPEYLMEIPNKFNISIDIMVEAKMKEQAIFRLYEKYPQLNCKIDETISQTEQQPFAWVKKNITDCNCCSPKKNKKRKKYKLIIKNNV
jgi:UV DNA damage endonuclease